MLTMLAYTCRICQEKILDLFSLHLKGDIVRALIPIFSISLATPNLSTKDVLFQDVRRFQFLCHVNQAGTCALEGQLSEKLPKAQ